MTDDPRANLRQALRDFVETTASRDPARVGPALARVQAWERRLDPQTTDPRLMHYLQQRSYLKALQYLSGNDPEQGSCR